MRLPGAEPLYDVMKRWVDDCLLRDGSLFEPGATVWSEANLAALKQRFVDEPNEDPEVSFEEKLAGQGEGATREAKLLFAEVRAIQMMPMAEVSEEVKRKEINAIFDALHITADLPDDVSSAFPIGFANYGMAKVHKYWHLCLIIERSLAFKRLDTEDQQHLLREPFAWKRFVQGNAFKKVGSQENMLLHIVHPDTFEPIPSGSDKMKIARELDSYAGGETDVDAALHKIHGYFTERAGGWISLYDDDIRSLWDKDAKPTAGQPQLDERETAWEQAWATWIVRRYQRLGGPPTVPDDPGLADRIRSHLEELRRTGDIDRWLEYLRTAESPALKHVWMGAHARTHKAIVEEATDPAAAARDLADSLVAPTTDEETVAKIAKLEELRQATSWGVWGSGIGPMVWHWQDPSIAPTGFGVEGRLSARGWFDIPDDPAEFVLRHTERIAAFNQDVRWMFAALSRLEAEGPLCLDSLPPVTFERCAAAADQGASLQPVIADLELLAVSLRRHLRLGDEVVTARSQTKGPAVWVEIRKPALTLLRLWAAPNGLALVRPAAEGELVSEELSWIGEEDGLPTVSQNPEAYVGRVLAPEEAEVPERIQELASKLAPVETAVPHDLRSLFERFQSTVDQTELAAAEADRRQLARFLTPGALAAPDLDAFRQIINTGRYGRPGPMPQLNTSVTQAAEEGRLDEIAAVFDQLCNGNDDLVSRIDGALASGISGLGSSVVMKLLAITQPSRVLPVFPLKGTSGKEAMLEVLGLPIPTSHASEGVRQVTANDTLLEAIRGLTTNLWEAKDFLYWLLERNAPDEADDEDRLARVVQDCYVPRAWVDEIVELLRDQKQIVLYGPPGTGKTWVALQLAEALAPDATRRDLVQFHPAYGYEDFFEGFRPRERNGTLVYELTSGPLKTFADSAAADPRRTYVLIIDEINRANLPKVFGELLFLLEYRNRSAKTMYGGEPFQLPKNLLIIATMNTADRSIALVDAALRRRFHFVPMFPDREPLTGTLRKWLDAHDEKAWIAELLEHVNEELVRKLGGPHLQIGPSHFMRTGISESVSRIWRYTIEPLIEEQLFGDEAAIDSLRWDQVSKRIAPTAVAVSMPADEPLMDAEESPADEVTGAEADEADEPGGDEA